MSGSFVTGGSGGVAILGLDELIDRFQKAEQSDRLEAALYDLGDQLQEEMNRNIGNHPTLKNAQEVRVKIYDGGGYAAIKPKTGGYRITKNRKAYRAKVGKGGRGVRNTAEGIKAWDLTRFTNDGHAIRRPKAGSKYYRPRIHVPYVSGKGYYDRTRRWAQTTAVSEFNRVADEMAGDLE